MEIILAFPQSDVFSFLEQVIALLSLRHTGCNDETETASMIQSRDLRTKTSLPPLLLLNIFC